jgi:hypothetical protein
MPPPARPRPADEAAPAFALLDALGQLPPAPEAPGAGAGRSTLALLRGGASEPAAPAAQPEPAPPPPPEPKPAAAVALPLAEVMRMIAEGLAAKEAARAASPPAAR